MPQKFFKKLGWFIFPLILIFGFPFVVLLTSGEFDSVGQVITKQSGNSQALYGLAYSNPAKNYKMRTTLERKPEILALGDSRVMQIRSEFFLHPEKFYNAGGAVARVINFRSFLEQIPVTQSPKILIIDLDQFFFNPKLENLVPDDAVAQYQSTDSLDRVLNVFSNDWYKVYQDYFNHKFSINQLFAKNAKQMVGLSALAKHMGFRNDGSYFNNRIVPDFENPSNEDYQFRLTFKKISDGNLSFERSDEISVGAVNELNLFLEECQKRGIYVVGFLPPYTHTVYQKIQTVPGYGYMLKLPQVLQPVLKSHGDNFFNFSDLAMLGASDMESSDFLHGSEKAYLRLYIKMAEADQNLAQLSNIPALKQALSGTSGNQEVFKNGF